MLTQSLLCDEVVLGLLHPHDCNNICKECMTNPILEMRKFKLSKMKRNSLKLPRFTEQNQDSKPRWPNSKALSSIAHSVQDAHKASETALRGRAVHVEGRLVIKAWKNHDVLGNYLTDNPRCFLSVDLGLQHCQSCLLQALTPFII